MIMLSLMYLSVIVFVVLIGLLIGFVIVDCFECKLVIVVMVVVIVVCGLLFSQMMVGVFLIVFGIGFMFVSNIMLYSFYVYQVELFLMLICVWVVGFVYLWSCFLVIFLLFVIVVVLCGFGMFGVFVFIVGVMVIVMVVIGLMGLCMKGIVFEIILK